MEIIYIFLSVITILLIINIILTFKTGGKCRNELAEIKIH